MIWTPAEYAAKPGWGARLPSTFRTYGTPPLGVPEESVTADWPAPSGWRVVSAVAVPRERRRSRAAAEQRGTRQIG